MSLRPSTLFGAILAGSAALFVGAAGCEFIASVDRSKIPEADAGTTTTTTGTGGGGGTGGTNTGGTTSTGGGGAGGGCQTKDDCPGQETDCLKNTCEGGVCGTMNVAQGTATTTQNPGDCKKVVCDGNGGQTEENDDTDVLDDGTLCTVNGCDMGSPTSTDANDTTACTDNGGTICDGAGVCVQCNLPANCPNIGDLCTAHVCVPQTCSNLAKDPNETDIDCGGVCSPCADGKMCLVAGDCTSGVCTGNVCQVPTCLDTVMNGNETDVDCGGGGACNPCAFNKMCNVNTDCIGGSCPANVCVATCTDTVKNGSETDVDCGGGCAANCADGKDCGAGADCQSGVCSGNPLKCQAPTCADGVKNGTETDVDCGGSCPKCGVDKACGGNPDCANNFCFTGFCGLNGCDPTSAVDITATPTIEFGGVNPGTAYQHIGTTDQACFKVTLATTVTFQGAGGAMFSGHPLQPGRVVGATLTMDPSSPITATSGAISSANFAMTPAGNYGFYCTLHALSGMKGALFVQ